LLARSDWWIPQRIRCFLPCASDPFCCKLLAFVVVGRWITGLGTERDQIQRCCFNLLHTIRRLNSTVAHLPSFLDLPSLAWIPAPMLPACLLLAS
jgi:hypothetical protein